MGKSGKTLKASLQSQQSRLKVKQKASQAAHAAEQLQKTKQNGRRKPPGTKGKTKALASSARRPTVPFRPTDKILLIGEGNFSFARALIHDPPTDLAFLPPQNITATAYDTEEKCYEKYPDASEIVAGLKEAAVEVLFGVDATRLERIGALKGRRWNRVVWNFPHAGKGITDQDRNILSNQLLVLGFLRSAAKVLALGPVPTFTTPRKKKRKVEDDEEEDEDEEEEDVIVQNVSDEEGFVTSNETVSTRGTILITLRNVPPYTQWDVPRLAKKPPAPGSGSTPPNPHYTLLRSFAFSRHMWSGYEHRMTKGERAHGTGGTGDGGEDRTWEFCLRD